MWTRISRSRLRRDCRAGSHQHFSATWRPNYIVRDVFSTKRDEFRQRATQAITARLGEDQIVVKEVLLRKV